MKPDSFAQRGLDAFMSAMKTVSEHLVDDSLLLDLSDNEEYSSSETSEDASDGGDDTSSNIINAIAQFYSEDAALPSFCESCLEISISRSRAGNENAVQGRLGIRNSVFMRSVESEYILIDAPLQRRQTLLIDPLKLIACVCQDFVPEGQNLSSNYAEWEILNNSRKELFRQFTLDFPRLVMVVDGHKLSRDLSADQCLQHLSELMGEELALQVLVLTTQGALAPIFNWVHSIFSDAEAGTHVTGGGTQEVHVQTTSRPGFHRPDAAGNSNSSSSSAKKACRYQMLAKGDVSVEVLLLKSFQVIQVREGEVRPQTDLWCQTRLVLAPYQGGEVNVSVPAMGPGAPLAFDSPTSTNSSTSSSNGGGQDQLRGHNLNTAHAKDDPSAPKSTAAATSRAGFDSSSRGNNSNVVEVPIPVSEGLLKMRPQQPYQCPFAIITAADAPGRHAGAGAGEKVQHARGDAGSSIGKDDARGGAGGGLMFDGRWELVEQQCECK
jgi:hypothetical protein